MQGIRQARKEVERDYISEYERDEQDFERILPEISVAGADYGGLFTIDKATREDFWEEADQ